MLSWLKENKDSIQILIAIGSIVVTAIVWSFNHQYNQYIRVGIIEQNVLELQRTFAVYHRTLLLTELVKVEQEIVLLKAIENPSIEERSKLIDLLVRQQILNKEIADLGGTGNP